MSRRMVLQVLVLVTFIALFSLPSEEEGEFLDLGQIIVPHEAPRPQGQCSSENLSQGDLNLGPLR